MSAPDRIWIRPMDIKWIQAYGAREGHGVEYIRVDLLLAQGNDRPLHLCVICDRPASLVVDERPYCATHGGELLACR